MTAVLSKAPNSSDSSFLEDEEYFKERLVQAQKALADFQEMKQDEGYISNGRQKWLNQQIDKKREEIKEMDEKLEAVA